MSEFFKGFLAREIVTIAVMLAVLLARLLFRRAPEAADGSFMGGRLLPGFCVPYPSTRLCPSCRRRQSRRQARWRTFRRPTSLPPCA